MKMQISERQILGAACVFLMFLCSDELHADNSSKAIPESVINMHQPETIEIDTQAIYDEMKKNIAREVALINFPIEQTVARQLSISNELPYYASLEPKKEFVLKPEK